MRSPVAVAVDSVLLDLADGGEQPQQEFYTLSLRTAAAVLAAARIADPTDPERSLIDLRVGDIRAGQSSRVPALPVACAEGMDDAEPSRISPAAANAATPAGSGVR